MFSDITATAFSHRMTDLFILDTTTLTGIMVWGNLLLSILIYIFHHNSIYYDHKKPLLQIALIRLAYAVGFFLLHFEDTFPNLLSVNLSHTIIFICIYCEMSMIMNIASVYTNTVKSIYRWVVIAAIITINAAHFILAESGIIVFCVSIFLYFLYFLPCLMLIISPKTTSLKRGMGIFYEICILIMLPRAAISLMHPEIDFHSNNVFQTISSVILIIFMLTSTLMFLLFEKERTDKKWEELTNKDELTGLYNRRYFTLLGTEIMQQCANKSEVTVLFLDVDHFSEAAEQYGRIFVDNALSKVAGIILENIRATDLCCRYGWDEFAILLSNVDEDAGDKVVERIQQEVSDLRFIEAPGFCLAVSVGVYCTIPKETDELPNFIHLADLNINKGKGDTSK